jgi:hypothetical protein
VDVLFIPIQILTMRTSDGALELPMAGMMVPLWLFELAKLTVSTGEGAK